MKILTIVVPTYNMQDYLARCLDSLVVKPELMDTLEVLVVNDGSKDDSSRIAHEYETRYPQTFRVIDKENGNYGSCVNRGLAEAEGKYIKILDADDWFDNKQFQLFLNTLLSLQDVDLIITNYNKVNNKGELMQFCDFQLKREQTTSFQSYDSMEYFAHHAITYRTSILRSIKYHQTEGISYTDNEWMYFPQTFVQDCIYLNYAVYQYVIDRPGQTMDPRILQRSNVQFIRLITEMLVFSSQVPSEQQAGYGYQRLQSFLEHTSKRIYKNALINCPSDYFDTNQLRAFDNFLLKYNKEIYERVGKSLKMKGLPIRYVIYWRKSGKRFPVDRIREVFRRLRYGK